VVALFLSIFVVLFLGLIAYARTRRKAAAKQLSPGPRCACGYEMRGWDQARCPECGRVIGFDASAKDLGLTEDELKRAAERRRERGEL
jgi:hypothetical protein